jgi:hypothetical protein
MPYAREAFDIIDVVHAVENCNGVAIEVCEGIIERVLARPADSSKWIDVAGTAPQSDHPIPAVSCRPEYRVRLAQCNKRARDMNRLQLWAVSPDDYDGARGQALDHAIHALTQIAFALRQNADVPWPWPGAIRRNGEPRRPAGITVEPAQ